MRVTTPWIYSPKFDLTAIIGPPVVVTCVVLLFGHQIEAMSEAPAWLWILLVLGIDVAHVYSSLFRTYFDREEFARRRTLYLTVPVLSWGVGVAIYALWGMGAFWSCVAYAAIYHFVRQQYGFMMLFRRGEPTRTWDCRLDQAAIYLATVYPLVYWHTYGRDFTWFENFEVIRIPVTWPEQVCRFLYIGCLVGFLGKEAFHAFQRKALNLGKVLLLVATAGAWGTGILLFNGDLTFTLINIVSHGVPYMALIWIYQYRKGSRPEQVGNRFLRFFQLKYVPVYLAVLFALAYFEEGLWDWMVWKESPGIFGSVSLQPPAIVLTLLVPLLTMPQVTHYVLDAFIWRVNKAKEKKDLRTVIG